MEPDERLQNMQAKIYFKKGRTPEGLSFDDDPRQKNMRPSFSFAPFSSVSLQSGYDDDTKTMFHTLEITDSERNQGRPFSFQYAESSNETWIAHPISCSRDHTLILNMKKANREAAPPIPVKLKLNEEVGFTELPDEVELYLCFQDSEGGSKRAVFRRFHDPAHRTRMVRERRVLADAEAHREEALRQEQRRQETYLAHHKNWTEYFEGGQDGPSPRNTPQLHDNAYDPGEWNTINNQLEKGLVHHKPYSQDYFTKDPPPNEAAFSDRRPVQDGSGHHTKKHTRKRRTKKKSKKSSKRRR